MIEVLKQALDAFHQIFESTPVYHNDGTCIINDKSVELSNKAIASLQQAIAELESQEPVGWHLIEALYPQGERLDIRMGDGSILCNLLPQADGDLWWDGSGTGEKFIDPKYANVTHWRVHSDTHPPQRKPLTDGDFLDWYDSAIWGNEDFEQCCQIAFEAGWQFAYGIKGEA